MKNGTLLVLSLCMSLLSCSLIRPDWSEWTALALMICAGIPHGSFDLRLAEAKWRGASVSRTKILAIYTASVIGMATMCVFLPLLGLTFFLLISAIHFAEGEASAPPLLLGLSFGIAAILLPIGLHPAEAQLYLRVFVPRDILLPLEGPLLEISRVIAFGLAALLLYAIATTREARRAEAFQRAVCLGAWIVLPPLSGFAVWFIGRHSRQHLETCAGFCKNSRIGVPRDFILISMLAIAGLLPFALHFDFSRIEEMFAAAICLIAGLTLPHMVVSHRIKDLPLHESQR